MISEDNCMTNVAQLTRQRERCDFAIVIRIRERI